MSNHHKAPESPCTKPLLNDINESNKGLISLIGRITQRYMIAEGLSDRKLATRIGCSHTMIFYLRKGALAYCGVSFLSRVALAFNCSLMDWVKSEPPQAV